MKPPTVVQLSLAASSVQGSLKFNNNIVMKLYNNFVLMNCHNKLAFAVLSS